jgi:hypothetical protein
MIRSNVDEPNLQEPIHILSQSNEMDASPNGINVLRCAPPSGCCARIHCAAENCARSNIRRVGKRLSIRLRYFAR